MHKREGSWCLPFPGADGSVVRRTQRALRPGGEGEGGGARPVHFRAYLAVGNILYAALLLLAAGLFYLFTRCTHFL